MQVRRTGSRKLFDKARKEVFLEWFAATCNVVLSAEKAGVCAQTIYKHLLKDDAFLEACGRALQLGYFRLEARELQEAHRLRLGHTPHPADAARQPPSPSEGEGLGEDYEIGILDDELFEEHFDPELALHLLREHRRHLPSGFAGPAQRARKNQRTTAETATNKEIVEALAKRLKYFAVRVQRETKLPPGESEAERDA